MDIKGSETEKNLKKAFNFTAKRRTEYDIYAMIAEKHGQTELSRLLKMFANMETEHSKLWYKWLNDGHTPDLVNCLKRALEKEIQETQGKCEAFAQKAEEEGFSHIAGLFRNIEFFENTHMERLRKLIFKLKDDVDPNTDGTFNWTCSVCGGIFRQTEEPHYCPLCVKENVFFYKNPN